MDSGGEAVQRVDVVTIDIRLRGLCGTKLRSLHLKESKDNETVSNKRRPVISYSNTLWVYVGLKGILMSRQTWLSGQREEILGRCIT
jgi:hypothetical protein